MSNPSFPVPGTRLLVESVAGAMSRVAPPPAFRPVFEAAARPDGYRNLSPEQAQAVAKLSPSYRSGESWGKTSNWLCSTVNRMVGAGTPFAKAYAEAAGAKGLVDEFERGAKRLKADISSVKSFKELSDLVGSAKESGALSSGLSKSAKGDGRARQCFSLMKNGAKSGDFVQTYEDGRYLIGYPTNLGYNRRFAAIGKWCHTGSFGDDGAEYWVNYAQTPVFYILDKQSGKVLCASWKHNLPNEVRDQDDEYPEGFEKLGWDGFFERLGLRKPMSDEIAGTLDSYDVPADASADVLDRIDGGIIRENLFSGLDERVVDFEYGDSEDTGTFYFHDPSMKTIDPSTPADEGLVTRYADDPGEEYYTFDEFRKALVESEGSTPSAAFVDSVLSSREFRWFWNAWTDAWVESGLRRYTVDDPYAMSERFSLNTLRAVVLDDPVRPEAFRHVETLGLGKKLRQIRELFVGNFFVPFQADFEMNVTRALHPNEVVIGYVTFDTRNGLAVEIDADEAMSEAERVGDIREKFERGPDILAINLNGKNTFAVKKVVDDEFVREHAPKFVGYVKYICKTRYETSRQMTLPLKNGDPLFKNMEYQTKFQATSLDDE